MKLVIQLLAASGLFALATTASAQEIKDIKANQPHSAYVQDQRNVIVRNPFGLCWRTGYYSEKADADQVEGCDKPVTPPPPPVVTPPPPPPQEEKAKPVPTAQKVTFAADAFFDFDKSILKPEAKVKLDDMVSKLKNVNLEAIVTVGHTDSVGTDAYNDKLSLRRAEAVKAYLVSKGIDEKRVFTEGKGKKQPVADNKTKEGRAQNRRVVIEVVGTSTSEVYSMSTGVAGGGVATNVVGTVEAKKTEAEIKK